VFITCDGKKTGGTVVRLKQKEATEGKRKLLVPGREVKQDRSGRKKKKERHT